MNRNVKNKGKTVQRYAIKKKEGQIEIFEIQNRYRECARNQQLAQEQKTAQGHIWVCKQAKHIEKDG